MKKICLLLLATITVCAQENTLQPAKIERLNALHALADDINRYQPIGDYFLNVPPFVLVSHEMIDRFIASMPAPEEQTSTRTTKRQRRGANASMRSYIQTRWQRVLDEQKETELLTDRAQQALNDIRLALADAFKHNLLDAPSADQKKIKAFVHDAHEKKIPLIVRNATAPTQLFAQSVFPAAPERMNEAIVHVLRSYFSNENIQQLLDEQGLPKQLDMSIILQHFIMPEEKETLVSGVSCSHEPNTMTPELITIESTFGQPDGIKATSVVTDIYHVYNKHIYPMIRKKAYHLVPDQNLMRTRLKENNSTQQEASSLTPDAAQAIARATELAYRRYAEPVCLWFTIRNNTIYILNVQCLQSMHEKANYVAPRYIKKCKKHRTEIQPITSMQEIIILKKRSDLILVPTIEQLVELYGKHPGAAQVLVGIVKEQPANWTRAMQLLEQKGIKAVWAPDFAQAQALIENDEWPVVIDPQQATLFTYKRKKGYCTLYHNVHEGIIKLDAGTHLSVLPAFQFTADAKAAAHINPEEFFGGVHMQNLFTLLRDEQKETARQALRTILFRLENSIKRECITQKEYEGQDKLYDDTTLKEMQERYAYATAVAAELYNELNKWHQSKKTFTDDQQLLFLINVLASLVLQEPTDQVILATSFTQAQQKVQ